jgi:translation elongation factor EF-4
MPAAQPELVAEQMHATFGLDPKDMLQISAKTVSILSLHYVSC